MCRFRCSEAASYNLCPEGCTFASPTPMSHGLSCPRDRAQEETFHAQTFLS